MEGLIPFVYKVIVEYKNGNRQQDLLGSWFNDSPSASYIRLPGDSGRFQASDISVFRSDSYAISSSSPPSSSASQFRVASQVHSPVNRRRVAA